MVRFGKKHSDKEKLPRGVHAPLRLDIADIVIEGLGCVVEGMKVEVGIQPDPPPTRLIAVLLCDLVVF